MLTTHHAAAKSGDLSLSERGCLDLILKKMTGRLFDRVLPQDHQNAQELVLRKSKYRRMDGALFHVENDKTLQIIPAVVQLE